MATLFFEGFDKGIVFNKLDPNYWSSQYKLFPKYSFGGYLPYVALPNCNNWQTIGGTYVYNSPNGGILPSGRYVEYYDRNYFGFSRFPGNSYPQIGAPPGFLALSNININNPTNVEFPTYLQVIKMAFESLTHLPISSTLYVGTSEYSVIENPLKDKSKAS
jgi:hypothetical protein